MYRRVGQARGGHLMWQNWYAIFTEGRYQFSTVLVKIFQHRHAPTLCRYFVVHGQAKITQGPFLYLAHW